MMLFLELSDDQTVDEDAAVAMMEQIAATLDGLDGPARDRFVRYTSWLAERTESSIERELIKSLPSSLGLIPGFDQTS